MENYKPPQLLASKIKQDAPTRTVEADRRGYYGGGYDETYASFESVLIYIQKGLANYSELIENVVRLALQVQQESSRKYPLIPMSFGKEEELTHDGKYFDLGYANDSYNDTKITDALKKLSTAKPANPAIIPQLFPKTDKRSLYHGKIKATYEDLLIIIGKKGQVYFDESLKHKLKKSMRQRILFVEIDEDNINWIYRKYQPDFINKNEFMDMKNIRTENFKLGTFHGKLNPENSNKEAKLRNALYLIGNLYLPITNSDGKKIRIIGYEVPLEYLGKRIDLLGYDDKMNPWVVELKSDTSAEPIDEIVDQVTEYSKILSSLIPQIKKEFFDRFFHCCPLKID